MSVFSRTMLLIAGSCLATATPVLAQTQNDEQRFQQAQQRFDNELNVFRSEFDRYQQARARGYRDPRGGGYPDPRYNDQRYSYDERDESGYDASRYYRGGTGYQERVLTSNDRVYRGSDGQYYCKRNDGTTGLDRRCDRRRRAWQRDRGRPFGRRRHHPRRDCRRCARQEHRSEQPASAVPLTLRALH